MGGDGGVTLFLCGDVMTGRGIDQILPNPCDPALHEPFVKSARVYVELSEAANGPVPRPVSYSYIWGDVLPELERVSPDLRLINLETAVTTSDSYWDKGINYRMNPDNLPCIEAAGIDFCSLANNHVLDWGYQGLLDTLEALRSANIEFAGAGRDLGEAMAPAIMETDDGCRVIVFSFGLETSGVPSSWAATSSRPGVNLLRDPSCDAVRRIKEGVMEVKGCGDIVVASIHWGGNWGYAIPREQVKFSHGLIDEAGVDLIHGHSSHHVRGIEVYDGKLVLYGCGDFIDDYEGIGGYEYYRGDLGLMYFPRLDPSTGSLVGMEMTPTQIRNLRVNLASGEDAAWLREVLTREGGRLGTRAGLNDGGRLKLEWD